MSDLVGNPEDRFSHNEAHNKKKYYDELYTADEVIHNYMKWPGDAIIK